MIAALGALGVAIAATSWLAQLLRGPTSFDRLVCAHAVRLLACLMLACIGVAAAEPRWIDMAIGGVLLDGVLVLTGLKSLQGRSFQAGLAPLEEN